MAWFKRVSVSVEFPLTRSVTPVSSPRWSRRSVAKVTRYFNLDTLFSGPTGPKLLMMHLRAQTHNVQNIFSNSVSERVFVNELRLMCDYILDGRHPSLDSSMAKRVGRSLWLSMRLQYYSARGNWQACHALLDNLSARDPASFLVFYEGSGGHAVAFVFRKLSSTTVSKTVINKGYRDASKSRYEQSQFKLEKTLDQYKSVFLTRYGESSQSLGSYGRDQVVGNCGNLVGRLGLEYALMTLESGAFKSRAAYKDSRQIGSQRVVSVLASLWHEWYLTQYPKYGNLFSPFYDAHVQDLALNKKIRSWTLDASESAYNIKTLTKLRRFGMPLFLSGEPSTKRVFLDEAVAFYYQIKLRDSYLKMMRSGSSSISKWDLKFAFRSSERVFGAMIGVSQVLRQKMRLPDNLAPRAITRLALAHLKKEYESSSRSYWAMTGLIYGMSHTALLPDSGLGLWLRVHSVSRKTPKRTTVLDVLIRLSMDTSLSDGARERLVQVLRIWCRRWPKFADLVARHPEIGDVVRRTVDQDSPLALRRQGIELLASVSAYEMAYRSCRRSGVMAVIGSILVRPHEDRSLCDGASQVMKAIYLQYPDAVTRCVKELEASNLPKRFDPYIQSISTGSELDWEETVGGLMYFFKVLRGYLRRYPDQVAFHC